MTESSEHSATDAVFTRQRAVGLAAAVALATAVAAALTLGQDVPLQQAAGLPLLVLGLLLVYWNTHWALCFAAFAIGPFGVVQQEIFGVTINLPEAVILALAAKEGIRFLARRETFPRALPLVPLVLFIGAAAIALGTGFARGNEPVRVLQDCRQFTEYLVLFWLVIQRVAGRDEALRIALSYVLGATVLAIHGIVQQFVPVGIGPVQIASDLDLYSGIRSSSFYGATTLGGLLVLGMGPAAGVALSSKRRGLQLLMGACMLLCLIAIILTRTRGSWLGLAVALALIGVSVRPSGKVLAAAAGAGIVLALTLGPVVLSRLYTLADPVEDSSLMARAQFYATAAHIGRAHPVLGLGWGCYYDIEAILRAGKYVATPLDAAAGAELSPNDATVHSAYLQLFVKTGLLGTVAFLGLLVAWIERVWRGRNTRFQTDATHALFIGITAGLAGYLFHSTFENFFQWPVMAQSFWLLFGLSFALAPPLETQRPRYGAPLAFMACAAAVFLVFMYACLRLETRHTDHYQRNVAQALEAGDLDRALSVTRRATKVLWDEPMPYALHARVLFRKGETEAAIDALERSVGRTVTPPAPPSRNTGPRYYFAPARLTWGKYFAGRGQWDRALRQFELARAHAELASNEYAEFHPVLYQAYATRGRWDRALDFGRPAAEELEALHSVSLRRLARVCAARGDWDLAAAVARALETRGDFPDATRFLRGRAALDRGDYEAAIELFQQIPATAVADAPYFLGEALSASGRAEEAVAAYLATPSGEPRYPIALAKAWVRAPRGESPATPACEAILGRLREALGHLKPIPGPDGAGNSDDPRPLACSVPQAGAATDPARPLVLLWGLAGVNSVDLSGLTGVAPVADGNAGQWKLEGTGLVLQMHQAENRMYWAGVEQAYPTDTVVSGWIDAARDWFDLRTGPSAAVYVDDAADPGLHLERLAWYYSVPAPAAGKSFLLLGRVRDPGNSGRFGWHFLDGTHHVVGSGMTAAPGSEGDWRPRAAYLPPEPDGESIRVVIETARPDSNASFDDVMLVELAVPDPALWK